MNREKQILATLIREPKYIPHAVKYLHSGAFFENSGYVLIYREILAMWEAGETVDQFALIDRLKSANQIEEAGGIVGILEICEDYIGSANIGYNLQKQAERYMLRSLSDLGQFLIRAKDYELADGLKALERAEDVINKLGLIVKGAGELPTLENLLPTVMTEIEQRAIERQKAESAGIEDYVPGLPTGIKPIDQFTLGLFPTELSILAARPGMGKTSLALQIAKNASLETNVAFFSLEMGKNQLVTRMLSEESLVNGNNIRAGRLKDDDFISLMNAAGRLEKGTMVIDDTPAVTLSDLKAKCIRIREKYGLGLIIVDYLQLMGSTGRHNNREAEVGTNSRGLKNLAKELNVPIVALAQLNRELNNRANRKPEISDLRESGSIEQDADAIYFIHRPGYFGEDYIKLNYKNQIAEIETLWPGHGVNVLKSVTQFIVGKNRFGSNREIPMIFRKRATKFEEAPRELMRILDTESDGDLDFMQKNDFDEMPF